MLQVGGAARWFRLPVGVFWEPCLAFPVSPWGITLPPSLLCVLQVKAAMYLTYLRAVGTPLCLYALFLFLCQQVASFCRGYWLSLWADDPTVDGRQTHAALRGWVFGLLGCLQGTPLHPPAAPKSSSGLPHLHTRAHPLFPEHLGNRPGGKHRPASLSWGWGRPYFDRTLRVSPSLIGKGRMLAPRFGGS